MFFRTSSLIFLLIGAILFAPLSSNASERTVQETYEHHMSFGYSKSVENAEFQIDGNIIGIEGLDTTVSFKDVRFNRLNVGYEMLGRGVFDDLVPRVFIHVDLSGGTGHSSSFRQQGGDCRPSRNCESFSDITAGSGDSIAIDAQFTLAFEFDLPVRGNLFLRPEGGIFKSYRKLVSRDNGYEHLDPFGWSAWSDYYPIGPVNNWTAEYHTNMIGPWVGLAGGMKPLESLDIKAGYRLFSVAEYTGEGSEWTTDNTKVQPGKSFEHEAKGRNHSVNAAVAWTFCGDWSLAASIEYKRGKMGQGDHKVYMVQSNLVRDLKLKESSFDSLTYGLMLEYKF